VMPRRGTRAWRTHHPRFQLLRGALLFSSSLFAFFSLKYMPVGEFTAVVMITPLVVTLLAATSLGERVSVLRWLLVAGGFVGTLVILRPGDDGFSAALLLPVGLVISNAAFQVLTSRLARTEDPVTMQLYTGWVGTALASLTLPFVWTLPPDLATWLRLLFMGLMATIGHFLLILAYARAPASTLAPYGYAQIGFAMIGGWLVFTHVPDAWSLAGMALVAACGALGAWLTVRESRLPVQPPES
jgi:drug/metabolite transporter (DMT)-like permease